MSMLTVATSVIRANEDKGKIYLVSRGTLLPSTQLSCSGTLSGDVVCTSTGSWQATEAGLPVTGGSCWGEFSDWLTWCVEPWAWFRAVTEGCLWWGIGHKTDPWWLDSCSVNRRKSSGLIFLTQTRDIFMFMSFMLTRGPFGNPKLYLSWFYWPVCWYLFRSLTMSQETHTNLLPLICHVTASVDCIEPPLEEISKYWRLLR